MLVGRDALDGRRLTSWKVVYPSCFGFVLPTWCRVLAIQASTAMRRGGCFSADVFTQVMDHTQENFSIVFGAMGGQPRPGGGNVFFFGALQSGWTFT